MNKSIASAFAITAATLFLACGKEQPPPNPPDTGDASAPEASDADADAADGVAAADVKCFGINDCSGQSACDVAGSHDCGGQNECKGKGWILVSQSECDSKGGEVL